MQIRNNTKMELLSSNIGLGSALSILLQLFMKKMLHQVYVTTSQMIVSYQLTRNRNVGLFDWHPILGGCTQAGRLDSR
jgi:hypothetical protein